MRLARDIREKDEEGMEGIRPIKVTVVKKLDAVISRIVTGAGNKC